MILDNLNISVIYQSTTATITNSGSDTISSVIDYDDTKLSITVNNDNTISISSLTNEKATYENIRVQGSTGDYVYITVNTLVNSTQPAYDIFDNDLQEYTLGGEVVKIGRNFYDTESLLQNNGIGYTDNDTLPSINSSYTLSLNKYFNDSYKGTSVSDTTNYTSYNVKNVFLCIRNKLFDNVTKRIIPSQISYMKTQNLYSRYKQATNGWLAQYSPLVEFDYKKLVFVLKFICTDSTNTVKQVYYDGLTSSDKIQSICYECYYNGVNISTIVSFLFCFENGDFQCVNETTNPNFSSGTDISYGCWNQSFIHGSTLYYKYYRDLFGIYPIFKPGAKSSACSVEYPSNNTSNLTTSTYNIGSTDKTNIWCTTMTNNDFLSWLNDFPFLWSTDGEVPTSVSSSDTNIKYKGESVNATNITKINNISNIKNVSEDKTSPAIDSNEYTDTTPYQHVHNGSYNTGFNKQFLLTYANVTDIANKFWGNQDSIIQNSKLAGENPLETVISLRWYPFDLSPYSTQTNINYYCGNYKIGQYETLNTSIDPIVDLGSIYIPRHYNNFLDFEPYAEIELFLPFCESISLSPREYLDTTLNIKMSVDWNTGACLLYIYQNGILKFTRTGVCGTDIQICGRDNATHTQEQINGVINTATSAANTVTLGRTQSSTGMHSSVNGTTTTQQTLSANQGTSSANYWNHNNNANFGTSTVGSVSLGQVASGIGNVAMSEYQRSHSHNPPIMSGTTTSTLSIYKPLYPYVIFRYSQPLDDLSNYGRVHGYACYYNSTVGANKGFTVCDNIDVNNLRCTAEEKSAILKFLTSGVIL